ncbi:hypothetical protein CSA56_07215 [candidate division KSB3 bacterium]|uniref:Glycosyltransferase 2-like domain-containing protein n=1 Tax=candidate division KSB3 bacterium TaxID=2044937 RepID=A0A2G6KG41_9BACT|nr:MAG: hypothetical protein CSA56_07215 [candidate division KSB3 bacterium]
MTPQSVSVIIVNWNGAQYLHSCLSSLLQQRHSPLEVLIVDNASDDESHQIVESFCEQQSALPIRWMQNAHNHGFCRGNNQGISQAVGEFILLLNADVALEADFISTLLSVMRTDPSIGISLGKLVSAYNDTIIDSTGITIAKNRRARDRGQGEPDRGQYASREEVFGASGAACLCRRSMLEEIKYPASICSSKNGDEYLDELFFAYKEDIDLSWRARLFGWKCVYEPDAVGRHYRNWAVGKRRQIPKFVRQHSLKNRYLMLLKNECRETLVPYLPHILWFECVSMLYIVIREPYLLSVIPTIAGMWPEIMRKRNVTHIRQKEKGYAAKTLLPWFQ